MFWTRKKHCMDPDSAHLIAFALEVSLEEIDGVIEIDDEGRFGARLRQHQAALAEMRAAFSATSTNLQEMADRTDAIASDLAEIEDLLDLGENDRSFHCALASVRLSGEARRARDHGLS